jgi:ribulose-phosphate 3-epimerase
MRKSKIIPAINAKTFAEIVEKINLLKNLTKEFHLDIASLPFANTTTWKNFHQLKKLPDDLKLDLHLMLPLQPQEVLAWNKIQVKSFIFHLEALSNPAGVIKVAKKTKKEIYIALSPDTELSLIEQFLKFVNGALVLGVKPGKAGQEFLPETYSNLNWIRQKLSPKQKLMIDGGINEKNLESLLSYEPDFIVLASAIYGQGDAKDNFLKFSQLVQSKILTNKNQYSKDLFL